MKILFCVLGRTASGKDTLVNDVCEEMGMTKLLSYTTRRPRSEFDETHIFTTIDKFAEHYREHKVAAYTQIGDFVYWSTKEQLEHYDFYVNDYVGLKQLKALNLPNIKIVTIYIKAPTEERHKRGLMRNKNSEEYWARNNAEKEQFNEIEEKQDWDYFIYNSRFADAKQALAEIVAVERTKENVF